MQIIDGVEATLKAHPFLSGLDPQLCELLCDCANIRRFAAHQRIFHEGSEADHFYLIINGAVALETFVSGSGMITIQKLGAGDALGWSWLFPPYQWHFTATTLEPTEVLSFDGKALRAMAQQNIQLHDELITRVATTLYQRLMSTRARLLDFCGNQP